MRKQQKTTEPTGYRSALFDWIIAFSCAVMACVIFLNTLFCVVSVDGSSMYPTYNSGDKVLVYKGCEDYSYGDIVVILVDDPVIGSVTVIKRVVGSGGDMIRLTEDGRVLVNGIPESLPFDPACVDTLNAEDNAVSVPEGCIYVLGDNRTESYDSRYMGCIEVSRVIGKVISLR